MSGTTENPNCLRIRKMLHELAQGRGTEEMRNEAGAHVNSCPSCLEIRKLAAELTCKDIAEFLDSVVEGRLTNAQQTVFASLWRREVDALTKPLQRGPLIEACVRGLQMRTSPS